MTTPRTFVAASDLPTLLGRVRAALVRAREEVDALNVFPVPDGDTGTNLVTTVQSAIEAVEAVDDGATPTDLARAAARGALRGAVGNSGVIFSQVVRAVVEHLAEQPLTAHDLRSVMARARTLSYDAVAEPLPGTILSAMDAAAEAADNLPDDAELVVALRLVLEAVGDAVAVSRDVLEANRLAGVVDAGARGFEVALDGVLAYLEDRTFEAAVPPPIRRSTGGVVSRESGSLTYAHEVQYLLEADDELVPVLQGRLEELGDSVVVVGCGGLLNVHVHTNDVDAAVDAGRAHGSPSRVEVTTFADQPSPADDGTDGPGDRAAVGYLAVVPGQGVATLARSTGAVTVEGAAGALPTVATVLNAVGAVAADEVVLLPGHPNVVPTMHQASEVSVAEGGRPMHVVDAADSVPAVLAVLAVGPTDAVDLHACTEAAEHVRSGEVVPAVRDARTPLGEVREGQHLAVVGGVVVGAHDDVHAAVAAVVDACVDDDTELVTLVAGAAVDDEEEARVRKRLAEVAPRVEVDLVRGEQRPTRWILGAE